MADQRDPSRYGDNERRSEVSERRALTPLEVRDRLNCSVWLERAILTNPERSKGLLRLLCDVEYYEGVFYDLRESGYVDS